MAIFKFHILTNTESAEEGWPEETQNGQSENEFPPSWKASTSESDILGLCVRLSGCRVVCESLCFTLLNLFPCKEHLWLDPCHPDTRRPCLGASITSR